MKQSILKEVKVTAKVDQFWLHVMGADAPDGASVADGLVPQHIPLVSL